MTQTNPRGDCATMMVSVATAAYRREFEHHFFFSTDGTDEWTCFNCENSWDLHTLWFCVLYKKESLRVLKPDFNLRLTCVDNLAKLRSLIFQKIL